MVEHHITHDLGAKTVQKLTDAAVRAAPEGVHYDGSFPGFGVRVGKRRRTFFVIIGGGRRQTIGSYPTVSLADARTAARRIIAEKHLGRVKPTHTAFDDAAKGFLDYTASHAKPRTHQEYSRIIKRHYPFGRQSIADIQPKDILKRFNGLPPSEKEHAFRVGRTLFAWAVRNHLRDDTPFARMDAPPLGKSRERVLSDEELAKVFKTAMEGDAPFHKIVALLCLTAQRRGEIGGLQWPWIDENNRLIELPSTITKNKLVHLFPYGPLAQQVLDSIPRLSDTYVFPAARIVSEKTTTFGGWGRPKERFDEESGVTGWTLHDIRRTVSTGMASLKVPQTYVEKLLNHVSGGSQSPIARIYNKYAYLEEVTEAVAKWESHLATLIAEA